MFGADSIVVASLCHGEALSLVHQAKVSTRQEAEALVQRAWALLLPMNALLLRRTAANTLLPGTVRREEVVYRAHVEEAVSKARSEAVPPRAKLHEQGQLVVHALPS